MILRDAIRTHRDEYPPFTVAEPTTLAEESGVMVEMYASYGLSVSATNSSLRSESCTSLMDSPRCEEDGMFSIYMEYAELTDLMPFPRDTPPRAIDCRNSTGISAIIFCVRTHISLRATCASRTRAC